MKLYHTGTVEIPLPDIRHGRVNADFGQGFYLTPDADFTYRWARKDAVVNEYELDLTGLAVHRFERSEAWFEYIFHNRRARDTVQADVIVAGRAANYGGWDLLDELKLRLPGIRFEILGA